MGQILKTAINIPNTIELSPEVKKCDNCPGLDFCISYGYDIKKQNGYEIATPCQKLINKQRQVIVERVLKSSRLPEYLKQKTFNNFTVNSDNQEAFAEAKRVANDYTGKGLLLMGGTGTGKTHLAGAILNKRLNDCMEAIFCTVPELLADIKHTFGNQQLTSELIELVKNTDLLILDDLGAEKTTEWVAEQLFVIINARLLNAKQTVITTNFISNKDLIDKLGGLTGQRIVSRLCEMCIFKKITGNDWRLK